MATRSSARRRRSPAPPSAPATRFQFFAGKGGVGKTTCAAAAALAAAAAGERVLIVSTDPAHSLGDALALPIGARGRRLALGRGALQAVELDADSALARWLGQRRGSLREIAERGTYLDRDDVERLLDLSLPGVDELVGLIEVLRLAERSRPDRVVVDTAPTGHTLRLVQTPGLLARLAGLLDRLQEKHRFLAASLAGRVRRDRCDQLIAEIEQEASGASALLRDPDRATFTWVLLPERLAVAESADGIATLAAAEIAVAAAVVNRIATLPRRPCPACRAMVRAEAAAVREFQRRFPRLPVRRLARLASEPRGRAALLRLGRAVGGRAPSRAAPPAAVALAARSPRRSRRGGGDGGGEWLGALAPEGVRLLLFGGKGGVGKTTCAAATALALARRGGRVLLLSTDPAHSLADVLAVPLGDDERAVAGAPAGLRAREVDAGRQLVLSARSLRATLAGLEPEAAGGDLLGFDPETLSDLLDLAPPGLDELFALVALVEAVVAPGARRPDVVVVDTAPTGHALRLLAMPEQAREWLHAILAVLLKYREVVGLSGLAEDVLRSSRRLHELAAVLADRRTTRFVPVTRPAALPRLETERLARALKRLDIPVSALVVNAVHPPACALCRRLAAGERDHRARLAAFAARSKAILVEAAASYPPPRGVRALAAWGDRIQLGAGVGR